MSLLQYMRRLYSLDTLDTRFTASKSSLKDPGAGRHTTRSPGVAGDVAAREATRSSETSSSLWETTEFYIYYIIFIVVVPLMFKVAIEVSNRKSQHRCTRWTILFIDLKFSLSPKLLKIRTSAVGRLDCWTEG